MPSSADTFDRLSIRMSDKVLFVIENRTGLSLTIEPAPAADPAHAIIRLATVAERDARIDALAEALAAERAKAAELEEAVEARDRVLNYWYPVLGYETANQLVYPAVGDPRAEPAPALAAERALADDLAYAMNALIGPHDPVADRALIMNDRRLCEAALARHHAARIGASKEER